MGDPFASAGATWLAAFQRVGRERAFEVHGDPGATHTLASGHGCTVLFDGLLHSRTDWVERFSVADASDADLVLQAYRQWGEGLLERVKGLFALIVWDAGEDLLLCARDPHGLYPFFYAEQGDDLFLSASVEALVRHPRISASVDRVALADHLCHRWPRLDATYFQAVRRLPGGYALRVRSASR